MPMLSSAIPPERVRVYLDTALLNRMADGKEPATAITAFLNVLAERHAVLIVSLAHVWDWGAAADPETRTRVGTFVDSIPIENRGVAPSCPLLDEPEPSSATMSASAFDRPPLCLAASQFETLSSGVDWNSAADLATVAQQFGAAAEKSRQAFALTAALPRSDAEEDTLTRVYEMFVNDRMSFREINDLLKNEHPEHIRELAKQAAAIPPVVLPFEDFVREDMRRQIASVDGNVRTMVRAMLQHKRHDIPSVAAASISGGLDTWAQNARALSPGKYLAEMVERQNGQDINRKVKVSDLADRAHIAYMPYVDYGTVDSANYAATEKFLKDLPQRRTKQLSKNGDGLQSVTAALAGR